MGLDMSYGLKFNSFEEADRFYDILCGSFINTENFSANGDTVSIYYRLNWGGVRRERSNFISSLIKKEGKPVNNKTGGKRYLFIENNVFFFSDEQKPTDKNTDFYLLDDIETLLDGKYSYSLNPVDLLSLGRWTGSNGESFLLRKEGSKNVLYDNTSDYDEELDDYLDVVLDDKNRLFSENTEDFNINMGNSISFIKDTLDSGLVSEYMDIKSREVMFILKYFMYNDVELFTYMG